MEQRKRLLGFLYEAEDDKSGSKPSSGGENPDGQEEQMSPEDAEKQFLQQKVKEFQQKKEQEKQIVDAEKEKTIDRFNKIHSKLGRLLATPLELAKLDKEREEDEKLERETLKRKSGDKEFDESVKSNKQSLIDKIKRMGFEHTSKGVWKNKEGKEGRITDNNRWELIDDVKNDDVKNDDKSTSVDQTSAKEQGIKQGEEEIKKIEQEIQKLKGQIKPVGTRKNVNTEKNVVEEIPHGSKAETAIADAINGRSTANKSIMNIMKKFKEEGLIPEDSVAEVIGRSNRYKTSDEWESKNKTPKTDIIFRSKNGIQRVSVKVGNSQLMSGMKLESRSVLKSVAKNVDMENDKYFKDVLNTINSFTERKKVEGGKFGLLKTSEADEIRKFNKEVTEKFRLFVDTNEKFRLALIKEAMTGESKFGKDSDAVADHLLYVDPKGDAEKSGFTKITDQFIKEISKKVSFNISMKTAGGFTSTALRLQVQSVNRKLVGQYLMEEDNVKKIDKDNFFDMFDVTITPEFSDDFILSKVIRKKEPNKKLQEHFETYELVEDD
jgi:hypothetical protein